jgi:hypothetical protein
MDLEIANMEIWMRYFPESWPGITLYKDRKGKTWQCEYVDFSKPQDIRLHPEAPACPQGFYYAKIRVDEQSKAMTVSQVRKSLNIDTGWGPEGFQLFGRPQG